MEEAIQIFSIVQLGIVGVSHILRPRVWVDLFVRLREWGEPGVLAVGFLNLTFGSIVVAFHNVWQGIPMLLTILGWAHVAKSLAYFAFPALGLEALATVSPERSKRYIVAGTVLLALAAALAYHRFRSG